MVRRLTQSVVGIFLGSNEAYITWLKFHLLSLAQSEKRERGFGFVSHSAAETLSDVLFLSTSIEWVGSERVSRCMIS